MLRIVAKGNGFLAEVSPPHSSKSWKTLFAIGEAELWDRLVKLGVHQVDIADGIQIAKEYPNSNYVSRP